MEEDKRDKATRGNENDGHGNTVNRKIPLAMLDLASTALRGSAHASWFPSWLALDWLSIPFTIHGNEDIWS